MRYWQPASYPPPLTWVNCLSNQRSTTPSTSINLRCLWNGELRQETIWKGKMDDHKRGHQ